MAELTQRQLEELDQGKPNPASATFYEKAALDVVKSKEEGRRVYVKTVYVLLKQPGVTDTISFKATPAIIKEYPEEYEQFQSTRQGQRKNIPIHVIPNLQMEHLQELLDMGITTTEQVVNATTLPPHLEYVRKPAQTFQSVLQETSNGDEKEIIQEERNPSEAQDVHALDRPQHEDVVGRPELQGSVGRPTDPATEGNGQGRRTHSGPKGHGKLIDNWKVEMVWRP